MLNFIFFFIKDIANKLRPTNFKMDADTSKVDSFHTTHNHYFCPRESIFTPHAKVQTTKSCIPQGDQEKAELPISDYKCRFAGIDTNENRTLKAKNMHIG